MSETAAQQAEEKPRPKPARCASCGETPESVEPLSPGWYWDTAEPDNHWLFCPNCCL